METTRIDYAACTAGEREASLKAAWIAVAGDEVLTPREREQLAEIKGALALSGSVCDTIEQDARRGTLKLEIPARPEARGALFDTVIGLVLADGRVAAGEREVVLDLARRLGIDSEQAKERLRTGPRSNPVELLFDPMALKAEAVDDIRRLLVGLRALRSGRRPEGRFSAALLSLIAADLLVVPAVLFFGWNVFEVVFLFWCETLVIGLWAIFRMAAAMDREQGGKARPLGFLPLKFFMIPFFVVHFGGFCYGHVSFIMSLFSRDRWKTGSGEIAGSPSTLDQVIDTFQDGGLAFAVPVLLMALAHGLSFFREYIGRGGYRITATPIEMIKPYGRIVILHVAIIFGGVLCAFMPRLFVLVLIPLKIAFDIFAQRARKGRLEWLPAPLSKAVPRPFGVRHLMPLGIVAVVGVVAVVVGRVYYDRIAAEREAGEGRRKRAVETRAKIRPGMTFREVFEAAGPWSTAGANGPAPKDGYAFVRRSDGRVKVWYYRKHGPTYSEADFPAMLDKRADEFARGKQVNLSYHDEQGKTSFHFDVTFGEDSRAVSVGPAAVFDP